MEHPIVVRRRRNPLEVRQLLERFDQSGLSAVEFAQNEGLHMSTFYRQLRRRSRRPADAQSLANQPSKVSFVEVDTTTSLSTKRKHPHATPFHHRTAHIESVSKPVLF
jgi:IS30 family transposase